MQFLALVSVTKSGNNLKTSDRTNWDNIYCKGKYIWVLI